MEDDYEDYEDREYPDGILYDLAHEDDSDKYEEAKDIDI